MVDKNLAALGGLYHVKWVDPMSTDGWVGLDKINPPAEVVTVGFLVQTTEKFASFAATISPEDDDWPAIYSEIITLPWGVIEELTLLEAPK